MNIFILDKSPVMAARMLCDKHVVNQPRETCQMLRSLWRKASHHWHPCTVWTRTSRENYEWHLKHGIAMCEEYTFRYDRVHACQEEIEYYKELIMLEDPGFPEAGLTPFHRAVADCDTGKAVSSYRLYYKEHKRRFAKWKRRKPPHWWTV